MMKRLVLLTIVGMGFFLAGGRPLSAASCVADANPVTPRATRKGVDCERSFMTLRQACSEIARAISVRDLSDVETDFHTCANQVAELLSYYDRLQREYVRDSKKNNSWYEGYRKRAGSDSVDLEKVIEEGERLANSAAQLESFRTRILTSWKSVCDLAERCDVILLREEGYAYWCGIQELSWGVLWASVQKERTSSFSPHSSHRSHRVVEIKSNLQELPDVGDCSFTGNYDSFSADCAEQMEGVFTPLRSASLPVTESPSFRAPSWSPASPLALARSDSSDGSGASDCETPPAGLNSSMTSEQSSAEDPSLDPFFDFEM